MKMRAQARVAAPAAEAGWRFMGRTGVVEDGGRLAEERDAGKDFIHNYPDNKARCSWKIARVGETHRGNYGLRFGPGGRDCFGGS